jgi:predicted short-subunit dehydrogenase-like oxidoreductase (DUF2520 family)
MKRASQIDVAIIGLGNWGTSLAAGLVSVGIPLREVIVRRHRRSSMPRVSWVHARLDARILWLCVPDSAIAEAAAEIAKCRPDLRGQIVVHSSGALTVAALDRVRTAGARVASVHPAMTFPTRRVVALDGVLFGIETVDTSTRRVLHSVVRKLGGQPFDIDSKNKALYHAAGTLASPLLVSELTAAIGTARLAGLDHKTAIHWVETLASATARNLFATVLRAVSAGPLPVETPTQFVCIFRPFKSIRFSRAFTVHWPHTLWTLCPSRTRRPSLKPCANPSRRNRRPPGSRALPA